MGNFLGKFPKLLVQQFNMLLCFQSKISFSGYFDFLFWFSSAILLSKIKSFFLNLYTSSLWVTPLFQLPITTPRVYVLIYKLKDFRWWNFDTQFEGTGVPISKVTILRSTSLINIYFFWNFLSKILLLIRLITITLF